MRVLGYLRLLPPHLQHLVFVCYLRELDLGLCIFDAEQAFVQPDREEDVFLRFPQGCGGMSGKVVRLNRSLYSLKQA